MTALSRNSKNKIQCMWCVCVCVWDGTGRQHNHIHKYMRVCVCVCVRVCDAGCITCPYDKSRQSQPLDVLSLILKDGCSIKFWLSSSPCQLTE